MDRDFKFLKEGMTADLARMLVDNLKISIQEALGMLYNSETYRLLSRKETGLYFQSPKYVYGLLDNEIIRGKFTIDEI